MLKTTKIAGLAVLAGAAAVKFENKPLSSGVNNGPDAQAVLQETNPLEGAVFPSLVLFEQDGSSPAPSQPVATRTAPTTLPTTQSDSLGPGAEFKTPAQVISEAIRAKAVVAVVEMASRDETCLALKGLSENGELSNAGRHLVFKACLSILHVKEFLSEEWKIQETLYLLRACGGGRARIWEQLAGAESGAGGRHQVEVYPSFGQAGKQWVVFLRTATAADLDAEGAAYFNELLEKGVFSLKPPNVFVLTHPLAGLEISAQPESVLKGVWWVPPAFLEDLKRIMSGCGGPLQTDLGQGVAAELKK